MHRYLNSIWIVACMCGQIASGQPSTDLVAQLSRSASESALRDTEACLIHSARSGEALDWTALRVLAADQGTGRSIREAALRVLLACDTDDRELAVLTVILSERATDRSKEEWAVWRAMLVQLLETLSDQSRAAALNPSDWMQALHTVTDNADSANDCALLPPVRSLAVGILMPSADRSQLIAATLLACPVANVFGTPELEYLGATEREILRRQMRTATLSAPTFPYSAASALASLGDIDALEKLEAWEKQPIEEASLRRFITVMADAALAAQTPEGLLAYISDGAIFSSDAICWAMNAAKRMGVTDEALRIALNDFAARVQIEAAETVKRSKGAQSYANALLWPVKVGAIKQGILDSSDWPEIKAPQEWTEIAAPD